MESKIKVVTDIPKQLQDPGIVGIARGPSGELYSPKSDEVIE